MRLLILTNTLKPNSGWGRYSLEVIKLFPEFGVDYKVLTEDDLLLPPKSIFSFIKNCLTVRKISNDFDVIHAFDAWPYGFYAYFACLYRGKKFFINAIGTYSVAPLQDFFKGFLLRLSYKNATSVFPISNFIKEKVLEEVKLQNIHTVYLSCSDLPHLTVAEIDSYKDKFSTHSGSPIILTVGEIKERKGQYEVVESLKILKEKYPDILYIMVGRTEKNTRYVEKINDFVDKNSLNKNIKIISNANSDTDLSFFYTISDVFILNSKQDKRHMEGFGIVMLEAASFGKPVIGAAGTALEETMKDGFNGLLVRENTIYGVSSTVYKVLSDKKMFGANSLVFKNNFSWRKTVSEYVRYYEE